MAGLSCGLGGGVYKDALFGVYSSTGQNAYRGLNAIGGWTQFKARFVESLEANASIGLDNGFAGDFHEFIFPPTVTATQLRARNRMVFGNLIFRPKTYLIFLSRVPPDLDLAHLRHRQHGRYFHSFRRLSILGGG